MEPDSTYGVSLLGSVKRVSLSTRARPEITADTHSSLVQVWGERDSTLFLQAKASLGYGSAAVAYSGVGDALAAGGALKWDTGGCVHNAGFVVASQICNAMVVNTSTDARARLCTATELTSTGSGATGLGCGVNLGCAHNSDVVSAM